MGGKNIRFYLLNLNVIKFFFKDIMGLFVQTDSLDHDAANRTRGFCSIVSHN